MMPKDIARYVAEWATLQTYRPSLAELDEMLDTYSTYLTPYGLNVARQLLLAKLGDRHERCASQQR
jgi:hypothetical protein